MFGQYPCQLGGTGYAAAHFHGPVLILEKRHYYKIMLTHCASETSVRIIRAFLTGRTMKVRVGESGVIGQPLSGGSPQGSILGSYLYCAATQQLGPELQHDTASSLGSLPDLSMEDGYDGVAPSSPTDVGHPLGGPASVSTPVRQGGGERGGWTSDEEEWTFLRRCPPWNRINDTDPHITPDLYLELGDDTGVDGPSMDLKFVKYIDDSNIVEGIAIEGGRFHVTTGKQECVVHPKGTESLVNNIIKRAAEIGTVVNGGKTQSLCISASTHTRVTSCMDIGTQIHSTDRITMLGFDFNTAPNVGAHFQRICNLFRGRFWALLNWKKAGFSGEKLYKLYQVFVQPVIEYCSPCYHPMLSADQANRLEGLQRKAFRLAFGDESYTGAVTEEKVESLEARRVKAMDKFICKAVKKMKFLGWFPRRQEVGMDIRNRRPILEEDWRTQRAYNGPIAAYRRRANEMIAQGKLVI